MKLADWMKAERVSAVELAPRCDVHVGTVFKWKAGIAVPRPQQLERLTDITGGAVTANDFHRPSGMAESQAQPAGAIPLSVLHEARALNIDAEAVAAGAIRQAVGDAKARRWQEENRTAIEAHNRHIEEHGLPLDKYRMF